MRILVICQYYHPEQFRINDICESLVSLGHEVTVLTGLPNYPQGKIYSGYRWFRKRKENISGVKVIRVPLIGRGKGFARLALNYISFTLTSSLRILALKKNFDVVYVYQLSPITMVVPALLYKKLTGKKVYLYCLDIWPESIAAAGLGYSSILYKILLFISRKIYRGVDRISVTSQLFIDYLQKIVGITSNVIKYQPQYAEELYTLNSLELAEKDESTINLLFAGNIGEMQSVETIIRAAAEINETVNVKWHIVGDGSARKRCEELAANFGLHNKLIFYGQRPVTEMPIFFSLASALLVTLKNNDFISYTLPGKVQSYMAAGKPIIGAINGETSRVIKESKCGFCCDAEDYRSLADIVREFASVPHKHKEFALNSRNYYDLHFSKEIFMRKLSAELGELIG